MIPREVDVRAATARAALGPDDVEWKGSDTSAITAATARILSIDALPQEQAAMTSVLEQWRRVVGIDAEIHLIERSRTDRSNDVTSLVRRRLGIGTSSYERDIVAAVREVGWTIVKIDRVDIAQNGEQQRWVDLCATDVVGQARRDST